MVVMRFVFAAFASISLLLFAPGPAVASPVGHWVLKAEGRTLSTLSLEQSKKDGSWIGTLSRPAAMESFRGSFYGVSGPISKFAVSGKEVGAGILELSVANIRSPSTAVTFLFQIVDRNHAALQPKGAGVEPWMLTRTSVAEMVSDQWNPREMYAADSDWPSNQEMKRLFDEDQAVRQNPATIDWKIVSRDDEARRQRTKKLLDAGKLRSGEDFYHAAFIFQHGGKPEDFLMAHTLATIANGRGSRSATWIAAATLDRYLQSIGQHQIYGTQYRGMPDGGMTQDPYNKVLMSDALRAAMGVPPLAEQEEQRKKMEAVQKR